MLPLQALQGPVFRQLTEVPQHDLVVIHADLDRHAAAVILVHHGIKQRLTQGQIRKQKLLDPLNALVAYVGLEVFEAQQFQCLLNLFKQIAVNFILIAQIVVGREKADLDKGARNKLLRRVAKHQRRRTTQIRPFRQLQVFQQRGVAVVQHRFCHTAAAGGRRLEKRNS